VNTPDQDPDVEGRASVEPGQRQVQSIALFRGHREIVILHQGTQYRLRITKGDKLILTK
jgi:hemin uptake protein HemP